MRPLGIRDLLPQAHASFARSGYPRLDLCVLAVMQL